MRLDHLLSKEIKVGAVVCYLVIKVTKKDPRLLSKGPEELLVAMRLGATPVPIPNTMVKP